MTDTPNLALPYIAAAQAQKHVTHNEALRRLDAIVQLSLASRALAAPPVAPAEGARYLVAAAGTGDWAGHDGEVAAFQDGAWMFFVPGTGWRAWVEDEDALLVFDGSAWVGISAAVNPAPLIGVNTTADATNKLAVKSNAVLMSHDDVTPGSGDVRLVLNKAAANRTGSIVFQNGFSGRAEFGLTGDDHWRVKVSANGSVWTEALSVDASTGVVTMPQSASESGAGRLLRLQADGRISPAVTGQYLLAPTSIADDAVYQWTPGPSQLFGAMILYKLTASSLPHGMFWARAASSLSSTSQIFQSGPPIGYYNTPLTGTTGLDGRLNVGVGTSGNIYFENRIGFGVSVTAYLFT